MAASIDEIADALRSAAGNQAKTHDVLAIYFADPVDVRHEPAGPTDGPMPKELLVRVALAETEAMGRALPDATSESDVSVDGDAIHVRGRTRGTLPDGTDVDFETAVVFLVADGAIVGIRSESVPGNAETMGKVFAEGKFELPPDLIARLTPGSQ
jgi:ketosteroid isomerase-like protein